LTKTIRARTHPFNGPSSRTTWVSGYQIGKTNLDFTEAKDSEWHQLGHMQICTSLQTNNHASIPPLSKKSSIKDAHKRKLVPFFFLPHCVERDSREQSRVRPRVTRALPMATPHWSGGANSSSPVGILTRTVTIAALWQDSGSNDTGAHLHSWHTDSTAAAVHRIFSQYSQSSLSGYCLIG